MFTTDFVTNIWQESVIGLGITTLQCHVLKAFAVIIAVNILLIAVAWHVYSKRITLTLASSKYYKFLKSI